MNDDEAAGPPPAPRLVVFEGDRRIADGGPDAAAAAVRGAAARGAPVLVFDLETGRVVDLDPRGEPAAAPAEAPRRGRPKLGVVAREVTLLPRHWDWLAAQPGGASVTLRRLIEQARKADPEGERRRARRDAAYRFMSAMAGDRPGFEEAARALFADDHDRLRSLAEAWPADVRDQVLALLDA